MMRRMIHMAAILVLLLLPAALSANDGGTESVFSIGAGARAMGMGNGYIALVDDATAVYYNPAALPHLMSQEISFLHTVLFAGSVYDFASYAYPHSQLGGFGIAAMRMGTDDIGRRDEISDLGRFSASQMQFLLSFGRPLTPRVSAGINLKLAHQSIDNYSAYGYGFDLAGRVRIADRLYGGILLQDIIGARMKLVEVRERTPFAIRGGLSYLHEFKDSPFSVAGTFDLEKPEYRHVKIRTGIEAAHSSGLALRGGYDRDNFTLGMGLRYEQLTFDYAYKFIDNLSDSHRFSLSFTFGKSKEERLAIRDEDIQKSKYQYLEANRQASLERELDKADTYFKVGQLDSALAAYYRADAFAESKDKDYIYGRITVIHRLQAGEANVPSGTINDQTEEIIRQATELMQEGALKQARDLVDAAINSKVDAAELFILRREIEFRINAEIKALLAEADTGFDQGNYIEAYNRYNEVLALDAKSPQAREGSRAAKIQIDIAQHLRLALDYFDQSRYILAQREFNTVLQLNPGDETARRYLQDIEINLLKSGTQAEKDLRQDKEMWQVYLDGVEAYRAGDFKKAIELWDRVLQKYPNDKMTLENKRQAELRVKE